MQKLEPRQIIISDGYFVSDCKFTKAGLQKFEEWFWNHKDPLWELGPEDILEDIVSDVLVSGDHPFYELPPVYSFDDFWHQIEFVENVDYVLEFKTIEAWRLERLAYELNQLHETMQEEMARLGW